MRTPIETVNRSKRERDQFGENYRMLKRKKHKKAGSPSDVTNEAVKSITPKKQRSMSKLARKGTKKFKKFWIQGAIKRPGALHRALGVKAGKKIPASKINAAAKKKGRVGKEAILAQTLKGFHHKK